MRQLCRHIALAALASSLLLAAQPALADSGQLRDPTRCGQAGANCRKLPPSNSDRIKDTPRGESDQRPKTDRNPARMKTSPLPSEWLQRPPSEPSSTGLDKGSTGLATHPRRKSSIGH
ncbi:MAG: hypothetical protein IPK59_17075 [Rhodospirillaceae bacterium]|nr:hypothetical protein [Rhodospirillaceae bacterium]